MKILFVSTEMAPFAKAGGLGDVAGALPMALSDRGHDVRVVMPHYPLVSLTVPTSLLAERAASGYASLEMQVSRIEEGPAVPVYLLGHSDHFQSATSPEKIYPQSTEAVLFFMKGALALPQLLSWVPDVIHCNDWQTGLIPSFLRQLRAAGQFTSTASVFTIHNLAHQGLYPRAVLDRAGLSQTLFHPRALEFYGQVNFLKGGLLFAESVNTVSPTYAREIQTTEFGAGLEGVLRQLSASDRLRGILNGIDTSAYNPETDPLIAARFNAHDTRGKEVCRAHLRQRCGLRGDTPGPLMGMVCRLFSQKGLDLLIPLLPQLVASGFQLVVLGQGERTYQQALVRLSTRYPSDIAVKIGYDREFGQAIYAGSDLFLMPSRFEPCGLGQMISQRYGSLPLVRRTGGLSDTVIDDDGFQPNSTGFLFDGYHEETLMECLKRARTALANEERWAHVRRNGLLADFSWSRSAGQYLDFYAAALEHLKQKPV